MSEFYDRNDVKISIRCFVPEIIEYNYPDRQAARKVAVGAIIATCAAHVANIAPILLLFFALVYLGTR